MEDIWRTLSVNEPPLEQDLVIWVKPTEFFGKNRLSQCKYNGEHFLSFKGEKIEKERVLAWCYIDDIAEYKEGGNNE